MRFERRATAAFIRHRRHRLDAANGNLRLPDNAARAIEYQRFVTDLAQVSSLAPM
jgi:hypothetical protein